MNEVIQRFGSNPHRLALLAGLQRAIAVLSAAGCAAIFLDGSFVTDKEFPEDYDVCWHAPGVVAALLDPVLLDMVFPRTAQKLKYRGEFLPAHFTAESVPPFRRFIDYFQTDEDTGKPKGIVGIKLRP
jgi:hypothetical protein